MGSIRPIMYESYPVTGPSEFRRMFTELRIVNDQIYKYKNVSTTLFKIERRKVSFFLNIPFHNSRRHSSWQIRWQLCQSCYKSFRVRRISKIPSFWTRNFAKSKIALQPEVYIYLLRNNQFKIVIILFLYFIAPIKILNLNFK